MAGNMIRQGIYIFPRLSSSPFVLYNIYYLQAKRVVSLPVNGIYVLVLLFNDNAILNSL